MILYINGDSNAAGAEADNPCAFAEDDSRYISLGRRPHPDNEKVSFGAILAEKIGWERFNDSESAGGNDRIVRTTLEYLEKHRPDAILIGWTTWEREEWFHNGQWLQVNCSGKDSVPNELRDKYRNWVITQSQRLNDCEIMWHDRIWAFHLKLNELKIPHLFFNCYSHFHWIRSNGLPKYDWGSSYISPYDKSGTYFGWLSNNGCSPISPESYHFGKDAHKKWAEFLLPHLTRLS
jgi:hypothetical protein